jgi:amino acid transporter
VGFLRYAFGELPDAESARYSLVPDDTFADGLTGFAFVFLVLRAFSSGCAALTGVQAISNGVPALRKPKGRNAATTLLLLGAVSVTMVLSVITLSNLMDVRMAENPATGLALPGGELAGDGYEQNPVIGQLAAGIFDNFPVGFYYVTAVTGVILILAANTAFNGFPVLGSVLARDGFLPRRLQLRGDRLAYSNGIVALALAAAGLILVFDAEVTRLIDLYIVGVFISFTASQLGMVRHWTRLLADERDPTSAHAWCATGFVNTLGCAVTGTVLVVVLVTKFLSGAWIAILAMAVLFVTMRRSSGTTTGWRPTLRSTIWTVDCRPASTPSCWSPSCTSRRCGRWPTPAPPAPTSSRRSLSTSIRRRRRACWRSGRSARCRCSCGCCPRRTGR